MPEFSLLPPLAIYVHTPWCVKKCPYCDFNSHTFDNAIPEKKYVSALLEDLEQILPEIWGRRITSIFIGGGTPSLFSAESIDNLLSGIRARIQCIADIEITLEANPGTVEQNKFNEFYHAGINRLSIGIQSFDNEKLLSLGRIHDSKEAHTAIETAQHAGFNNINLDLMFGLPQQTIEQGINDLQQAIEHKPAHISWYQLTIEPNTLFYNHPPATPDDDYIFELQQAGQSLLNNHSYHQYEISAYAKNKNQCQHNLNYWQFGDYIALGAGAHGKITRADQQSVYRYWKIRQPQAYMNAPANERTSDTQTISNNDLVYEFMLNALRLKNGFDVSLFETHTGLSKDIILETCQQAQDNDLLTVQNNLIKPTELGYRFLNDLINHFANDQ